jgi:hypothetical protein
MAIGIVGKKAGMTRVFTEEGQSVAVTVLQMTPNRVTQVKTPEVDGYSAIQVTYGEKKASRVSKPAAGQFAKANVEAGTGLMEFRTEEAFEAGQTLTVEQFENGQMIDVTGTSACRTQLTVTLCLTVHLVLLASVRPLVVYGKAKRWQVTWVLSVLRLKAYRLCV